ncbi:MAG: MotA/TolQ/ExbB proton channel family protein, partial [Planctomycetaceae bacterium]
ALPIWKAGGDAPFTIAGVFREAGAVGLVTVSLSIAMVAIIIENFVTIRRGSLMPRGLAEQLQQLLREGQLKPTEEAARQSDCLLGDMVAAGVSDSPLGYARVEKAMEDVCARQTARFMRRIEYLAVIGTVAPMLGLLGTVWGVMVAFLEFTGKANVQVTELAPGIAHALVNTFIGLCVAIPAFGFYGYLRNRIEELVALTAEAAEWVFSEFKLTQAARRQRPAAEPVAAPAKAPEGARQPFPSVTIERGRTG